MNIGDRYTAEALNEETGQIEVITYEVVQVFENGYEAIQVSS